MFKELFAILKEFIQKILQSRLFPLVLVYTLLFSILIVRLFQLQIVEKDEHLNKYIQKSLNTVSIDSTRGNIYDRNGVLLAYNKLVYSVTLKDIGVYIKQAQKNQWVYELVTLLHDCEEDIIETLPLGLDENNEFIYTTTSENQRLRLLRDVYGLKSTSQLDDENGKYPSDIPASRVIELLEKKFYFERWVDADNNPIVVSNDIKLDMLNIRWGLNSMRYTKYKPIIVASNVSANTMTAVLEHAKQIQGVDVEEEYVRVYPDGFYFAHIIGYTGKASTDQLAELTSKNPDYEYGDVIGRSGIESLMELELKGVKGKQSMYLDSAGKVIEVIDKQDAIVGNDIYLNIDHDLTIACYYIIEQTLAAVILDKIVFEDVDTSQMTSDNVVIPIKEIYYQLINNNVISIKNFALDNASSVEKAIYKAYKAEYNQILMDIQEILKSKDNIPQKELTKEQNDYLNLIFQYVFQTSKLMLADKVDENNSVYKAYLAGETSLRNVIYTAISNEWVDISKIETNQSYLQSDEIYKQICTYIYEDMMDDVSFAKIIYKNLIQKETITGAQLELCLYEQNIITRNEANIEMLKTANNVTAYEFMVKLIKNMQITPAQLALDPCNAAAVVTDVNTGELLSVVSYPGYDINQFSGSVDSKYYNQLLNDLSNPLYNHATQSKTSPGSTYKMLTSIAGLEEGVITIDEEITCLGLFEKVSPAPKCWIYRSDGVTTHGPLSLIGGLANSCNYYYYEIGHRLSLDENGNYDEALGIARLKEYAEKFGLGQLSCIEIDEAKPHISDAFPVPSAIGQGTNNYTTIQLSRYVTAIASGGNLYSLSLIDKVCKPDGTIVKDYTPAVEKIDGVSKESFAAVQAGMRAVIEQGTVRDYFTNMLISVAGKTGSAQEDIHRPNHAHFVSYAPFENPEISVTASIRNGYTAAYTAMISRQIYEYYYGEYTLEEIKSRPAYGSNGSIVGD